jgi:hypothetical protein
MDLKGTSTAISEILWLFTRRSISHHLHHELEGQFMSLNQLCCGNGKTGSHGSACVVEYPPAHGNNPAVSVPDPTAVSAGCHAHPKSDMNSV